MLNFGRKILEKDKTPIENELHDRFVLFFHTT